MTKLGINIDHVATIRQARRTFEPDPVQAALECEKAGCDSIVCHLRKDRRHIQDDDLYGIKKAISLPLNMEMSVDPGIVDIARRLKPFQTTVVPENRVELTTEGGLDVISNFEKVKEVVDILSGEGIKVSLFVDPEKNQIESARAAGAGMVEIHTGRYAERFLDRGEYQKELGFIRETVLYGMDIGLTIAAGHGLTYENVREIASIPGIYELNIGHSVISNSVFWGIKEAVSRMKELLI